jgi:hypothetical protein
MTNHNHRDWEVMPKLAEFPQPNTHESVLVNPTTVRFIRPGSPGHTAIYFDKDHSVLVVMPVDQVRQILDYAMNEK